MYNEFWCGLQVYFRFPVLLKDSLCNKTYFKHMVETFIKFLTGLFSKFETKTHGLGI